MSSSHTALLVIDVQESFRHTPYFQESELPAYLEKQQALIDGAEASGIPVVQIFHVDGDRAFAEESGYIRALEGVRITPDVTFRKNRHSAFAGTGPRYLADAKGYQPADRIRHPHRTVLRNDHPACIGPRLQSRLRHRGDAYLSNDARLGHRVQP